MVYVLSDNGGLGPDADAVCVVSAVDPRIGIDIGIRVCRCVTSSVAPRLGIGGREVCCCGTSKVVSRRPPIHLATHQTLRHRIPQSWQSPGVQIIGKKQAMVIEHTI